MTDRHDCVLGQILDAVKEELWAKKRAQLASLHITAPGGWGLHCGHCGRTVIAHSGDEPMDVDRLGQAASDHAERCTGGEDR